MRRVAAHHFGDHIRAHKIEAHVESSSEAILVADVYKVRKQLFGNRHVARDGGCDHGVLEQLVLL